jgi:hypothetical protein
MFSAGAVVTVVPVGVATTGARVVVRIRADGQRMM